MPPNVGNIKIVVIWQEDIILAAQALYAAINCKDASKTDLWVNALRACHAAIYSPDLASGEYAVTIMSATKFKKE